MNPPPDLIATLLDGAPFRSNQIHERDRWLIEEAYKAGASQNLKPCLVTELSPAAQAVLTAFGTHPLRADHIAEDLVPALAAALRAVAKQLGYSNVPEGFAHMRSDVLEVDDLLALAAELEAKQ